MEATTLTMPASEVVMLFDGGDLAKWTTRDGSPAQWRVDRGILTVVPGAGDILTRDRYMDFYIHAEFRCPLMPEAMGQDRGNSGIFLQGRYEVQILDSHGINTPDRRDCGALYNQFAPLVVATKPPEVWQSFDLVFRAPRARRGILEKPGRLTAFHNGRVIHNNIEIAGTTRGALDDREGEPGPILLQEHHAPVSFRSIWLVPLGGTLY